MTRHPPIAASGLFHYSVRHIRTRVREELFNTWKLIPPLIKTEKKGGKSGPAFETSSWIWYTHYPTLIPPPPQTEMTSLYLYNVRTINVMFAYHTESLTDESCAATDWFLNSQSAQILLTDMQPVYSEAVTTFFLRHHGISLQELMITQEEFQGTDSKTRPPN